MSLFRGSKNATIVNGEIVATAQDIADAVNDAIAAKNAAEAAEAGAQTAETNAETAETNAETAETNAETAESGAVDAQSYAQEWANKPEDSLVSTNAGGDGVDDFSALHHANKASASASAASTSESNALTSEQNAQQAATDAETALDTFTDQYLGAKASDPATDNDGDPLQDGALYFNNTDGNLRIYSDSLSDWVVVEVRSDSEIRSLFSAAGDLTYNSTTGEFSVTTYKTSDFNTDFGAKDTDDLTEGTGNLYYTDTRARGAVSASGDLSYNATTGTFSFTETPNYTDADVDAHLTGGKGVTYTTGTIAIGQDVGTSASVTFLDAEFTGTGAVALPDGTQAQRPGTPLTGMLRFNTDLDSFEGYDGVEWGEIGGGGGGATGGGTDAVFIQNDQTVTSDYTIPADQNAMSTGPIEIDDGVTVTVSSGSRWVVI